MDPVDVPGYLVLRVADPTTGDTVGDQVLMAGSDELLRVGISDTELYLSRRTLQEVWVFSLPAVMMSR